MPKKLTMTSTVSDSKSVPTISSLDEMIALAKEAEQAPKSPECMLMCETIYSKLMAVLDAQFEWCKPSELGLNWNHLSVGIIVVVVSDYDAEALPRLGCYHIVTGPTKSIYGYLAHYHVTPIELPKGGGE